MLDEAFRAAVMNDAAGVDEEKLVTHFSELREDVRTDEMVSSLPGEEPDQILEFDARLGIETCGWFVEDEHFRVMNERAPEASRWPMPLDNLFIGRSAIGDKSAKPMTCRTRSRRSICLYPNALP